MGMLEKSGEDIAEVIPDRSAKSLMPHIHDHIEKRSEVHTGEHGGYNPLERTDDYERLAVVHVAEEYVGDLGETTNSVEAYHRRNAHQLVAQAPVKICQRMRVQVQSSPESGFDAT